MAGDERLVRLGVCASAVKYDWLTALMLARAGEERQLDYGGGGRFPRNAGTGSGDWRWRFSRSGRRRRGAWRLGSGSPRRPAPPGERWKALPAGRRAPALISAPRGARSDVARPLLPAPPSHRRWDHQADQQPHRQDVRPPAQPLGHLPGGVGCRGRCLRRRTGPDARRGARRDRGQFDVVAVAAPIGDPVRRVGELEPRALFQTLEGTLGLRRALVVQHGDPAGGVGAGGREVELTGEPYRSRHLQRAPFSTSSPFALCV